MDTNGSSIATRVASVARKPWQNYHGVSHVLGDKLVNGSRVGQVGPVDSCVQVQDLVPSLVNSHNLSRVGQVRPIDSTHVDRS